MDRFRKNLKILAVIIFMALLVGPTIFWYSLNLEKTLDFDLGEKRNKATLSEAIDIETFSKEYEAYYNDRVPFRSVIINNKKTIDSFIENPYRQIERNILHLISRIKRIGTKAKAEEIDDSVRKYMDDAVDIFLGHGLTKKEIDPYDTNIKFPLKYSENGKVIIGQSDWLYLNQENINLYKGKYIMNSEELYKYMEELEYVDSLCKSLGKQIVFLICPEKEEIYPEYMPYMEIENEKERVLHVMDYIATASNIKYIYPKNDMISLKDKYLLYKKYDSHWNDIGAYVAVKKIYEALGIDAVPLRDLLIWKCPMRDYELIPFGNFNMNDFSTSFEYGVGYKPEIEFERSSIPGDNRKASYKSKSNINNGKSLTILGDSFSHAMIQYLIKDFETFHFLSIKDTTDEFLSDETIGECIKNSDTIILELVERNDKPLMHHMCFKIAFLLKKIYGR